LSTTLTIHKTTENNSVISHAQNTTAHQPSVFLTVIYLLLVTNKARSSPRKTIAIINCKLHSHFRPALFWDFSQRWMVVTVVSGQPVSAIFRGRYVAVKS